MQKLVSGCLFSLILSAAGCQPAGNFDEAIQRAREQGKVEGLESAPSPGGLPFLARDSLDPSWNSERAIRLPEIELVDAQGKGVSLASLRGRPTVVGFFFASCTGFCPLLIRGMKSLEKAAPQSGVRYVFISVDPEQDQPEVLKRYARSHGLGKNWTLLTGDRERIYRFAKETLLSQVFEKRSFVGERNIVHTENFYVFDAEGRLRSILNGNRLDLPKEGRGVLEAIAAVPKI